MSNVNASNKDGSEEDLYSIIGNENNNEDSSVEDESINRTRFILSSARFQFQDSDSSVDSSHASTSVSILENVHGNSQGGYESNDNTSFSSCDKQIIEATNRIIELSEAINDSLHTEQDNLDLVYIEHLHNLEALHEARINARDSSSDEAGLGENQPQHPLPIATLALNIPIAEYTEDSREENEIIKQRLIKATALLLLLVTIVTSVSLGVKYRSRHTKEPIYSRMYLEDYVKSLILPISGEETLNDTSSIQHFFWKNIAFQLPGLIDESILSLNDTHKIIQRYCSLVIRYSAMKTEQVDLFLEDFSHDFLQFGHECDDIFICDEERDVIAISILNDRHKNGGGYIAKELGSLTTLLHFVVTHNAITGTIPTEIGNLHNLQTLIVYDNMLSGAIPSEIGQLQDLEYLLLNLNKLEDELPFEIGQCVHLQYFDLSRNQLSGTIPASYENLTALEGLALYGNNFTGNIDFLCDDIIASNNSRSRIPPAPSTDGIIIDCEENNPFHRCSCCNCI